MSDLSNRIEPILLLAPTGMLGRAWGELLDERGMYYRAVGRPELDLANPSTIPSYVTSDLAAIVNCAAWTDVDGAEEHEAEATAINGAGVGALADACRDAGATLVHYSTDYVFNGRAATPYRVDQPRDPINAYGRSKARGEQLLEASGCDYLLIRTSWLYAPWGNNFVRTMARLTAERDALRVVDDQRGRPTSCHHLAAGTLDLLERRHRGTFHVTDGGECTWCGLTREINHLLDYHCDVQPCTTADFSRPAPRPAYSVLDLSQAEAAIGPMPGWRDNLRAVFERM